MNRRCRITAPSYGKSFELLAVDYPDQPLYHFYLQRLADLQLNPPPAPWDGVFVLTEK